MVRVEQTRRPFNDIREVMITPVLYHDDGGMSGLMGRGWLGTIKAQLRRSGADLAKAGIIGQVVGGILTVFVPPLGLALMLSSTVVGAIGGTYSAAYQAKKTQKAQAAQLAVVMEEAQKSLDVAKSQQEKAAVESKLLDAQIAAQMAAFGKGVESFGATGAEVPAGTKYMNYGMAVLVLGGVGAAAYVLTKKRKQ